MADRSIALPATKQWEFGGQTFEQSELTIDGEAQLLSLTARTVGTLAERGFPFERLAGVIEDSGAVNMRVIGELLPLVMTEVPEFASESAVILFGIFPVDEEGKLNPDYDRAKRLLRRSLKFTSWFDMLELFMQQNDYQRLIAPFASAVMKAVVVTLPTPKSPESSESPSPTEMLSEPFSKPSTPSSAVDTARPVRSRGA